MESLTYETKNGWLETENGEAVQAFGYEYIDFLNAARTERQAAAVSLEAAKKAGFEDLEKKESLAPGDKVFVSNRGKALALAVIGEEPVPDGFRFILAHIDAPRIDLKPNPLYEEGELALFKTHYYGGIKKYQWTAVPLALIGVMFTKDGEKQEIEIGTGEGDPVFTITDLLPHLSAKQMEKKLGEGVEGENLNVLVGSIPGKEGGKEKVKARILGLLNEKYGVIEEDFLSAELEIVPAFSACDAGLDRSLVGGYGQDDRVCAYTALRALLEAAAPKKTAVCFLADKEEIGSMGNTGMRSAFFEYFCASLIAKRNGSYNELDLRRAFRASACLSADVAAGQDPTYGDALEKRNAAYLGRGAVVTKYTGSRGKSGTSDANAEFVFQIRKLFNENKFLCQTGELGRVALGGGGTVALFAANLDMDVLDVGAPLLSMHSPFEIASKIDVFEVYRAYSAFFAAQ
jgi:aspartyl aminopeptidase